MSSVHAVISDFGGVLTSPLLDGFLAFQSESGISLEQLGHAMADVAERTGENPLFELERGRLAERRFRELLEESLARALGRPVSLADFHRQLFERLEPNVRMIDYMRSLRNRGFKLAICTNNVREWEAHWRAMLPVDEIFDAVVDSAFVGVRKPDPEIYRLTLERLGVSAATALLVDDIEINCDAARELGMQAVWFQDTDQAITEIEAALAADQFSAPRRSQQ